MLVLQDRQGHHESQQKARGIKYIHIILTPPRPTHHQSSWLLEALSEVGPSCDKLTIICAPPQEPLATAATAGPYLNSGVAKPTFRIRAVGSFGSTEVNILVVCREEKVLMVLLDGLSER